MLHLLALLLLTFAAARRVHPANNTHWCIHALAVTPRSGTQLGVEECTGSFRQDWNFFGSSSILQLKGTNLCAAPAAKYNGARVYLRECPYDRAQWGEITWHPAGGLRLSYDNTSESAADGLTQTSASTTRTGGSGCTTPCRCVFGGAR
jgi:hypothetical protein